MLTLLIIILLLISGIIGYHRGLVAGMVSIASYVISFWVAWTFSHQLAQLVKSAFETIGTALASGIAFFILFLISYLIMMRVSRVLKTAVKLPGLKQLDHLLGAIAGFIMGYLLILIVLIVLVKSSQPWFVTQYVNSNLAQTIVNQTPLLTHNVVNQWLNSN
ncbi:CvpA family protein [Nicoliella lavandulae]|uniref:CvpA family protein n=1 Tax=Nicoliella lavandulae TaxID=3082954 RepID=A0ABU8SLH5_9LACO